MPDLTIDPRIELLTKVAGLAGSAIAVSKVLWTYVNDLSFKRKIARAANDIDSLLPQMAKLKCDPWQLDPTLQSYAQHMEDELQERLERLAALKAEARNRAARRNEEPRGIKRSLLLYRPEGIDGLSMQSFFYFTVMGILLLSWYLAMAAIFYTVFLVPIIFIVLSIAVFERSIALRLKRVGNAVRLNCVADPNDDLRGIHRLFALYSWRDGQWFSRAMFYVLFAWAVYVQIAWGKSVSASPDHSQMTWQGDLFYTAVILFFAQMFRVDALSRRAKRRMSQKADLVTSGVAEAAPTV